MGLQNTLLSDHSFQQSQLLRYPNTFRRVITLFENLRKSLIFQDCERVQFSRFSCLFTSISPLSAVCFSRNVVKMRPFWVIFKHCAYWIEFAVVCPPPSKQILCESLVFTKACYAAFSLHFRYKIRTRLDYRLKSTVFWNNVQKCLFWIFTPKITFVPFVLRIFPNVWILRQKL